MKERPVRLVFETQGEYSSQTAAIKDVLSRMLVGWRVSSSPP
jgi:hypothetical protein